MQAGIAPCAGDEGWSPVRSQPGHAYLVAKYDGLTELLRRQPCKNIPSPLSRLQARCLAGFLLAPTVTGHGGLTRPTARTRT